MKINLVSDLHLDVNKLYRMVLPGGDVLILAGDICEAKTLLRHKRQWELLTENDRKEEQYQELYRCWEFFATQIPKYKKVFMVMGNHEHYRGRFDKTWSELTAVLPDNVTLLEDQCEEYEGVLFVGSTLWTDMNKADPITMFSIKNYMNDYRVIQNFYPAKNLYHKLTPEHTVETHRKSKAYIQSVLRENTDKPVVVITHMAPSFQSVNIKYVTETLSNGAYCSELSNMILDNPNIKVWVHGHVHDPVHYDVGTAMVHCNPRGYLPWEQDNGFDPCFFFEVKV